MAQEIERARTLLRALAADNAITQEAGTQIYQGWVGSASSDEVPFSRYLIEQGEVPAALVQRTLRRLAVQGLTNPDVHTRERFEDLILCQLGVESGLISPKLVKTVRAVQEKKLKQGKLRRVRDLLPRAGFDPKTLALLEQHMRERVLICPECLTRYPPAEDAYYAAAACPRCGAEVSPEAFDLEASAELQRMPEHLRVILNESAERVYEPMPVQNRERPRRRQSSTKTPQVLLVVCVVTLLVVGGLAWSLSQRGPTNERPPGPSQPTGGQPPTQPDTPAPVADPSTLSSPELMGLIAEERRLTERGDYAEALRLWRQQTLPQGPTGADVRQEVGERVARLERLTTQAEQAQALLGRLQAGDDPDAERSLALLDPAADTPPFDEVRETLARARRSRREALREAGARRYDSLEVAPVDDGQREVWSTLSQRVAQSPVELSVDLDGELERARLTQLGPRGATLEVKGARRELAWEDAGPAALEIVRRVARSSEAERLLVLRFALYARDAEVAREVAGQVEAPVPVDALLEGAELGAAPEVSAQGLRLTYDLGGRRWPRAFTRSEGTVLALDEQGAWLRGSAPAASTPTYPLRGPRIAGGCEVERDPEVAVTARLEFESDEKTTAYELRWSEAGWVVSYDDGRGTARSVEQGPQVVVSRRVELAVVPGDRRQEIVVRLAGAEVYRRPLYEDYRAARFRCSAEGGSFRLDRVWVVGDLDPSWVRPKDEAYRKQVALALSRAVATQPSQDLGAGRWPELSVEDAQGLARLSDDELTRLDAAKAALRERDLGAFDAQLAGLDVPVARFYQAYRACVDGAPATAAAELQALLSEDGGFAGARALLACAYALAGRADLATGVIPEAIAERPDLPWAHLADARARWLSEPLDHPLEPGKTLSAFEVPAALAPGDPLVVAQSEALREVLRVEQALEQRFLSDTYSVAFSGPTAVGEARDVAEFLAARDQEFARVVRGDAGRRQRVWLLAADSPLEVLPGGARAGYLPAYDALVFKGSPAATPEVVRAAAEAYLARNLGLTPPWLRLGLLTEMQTRVAGAAPLQPLAPRVRRERWKADRWKALFTRTPWELEHDVSAQAHAWALVHATAKLNQLQVALGQDLEGIRDGQATAPHLQRLDYDLLSPQIAGALD